MRTIRSVLTSLARSPVKSAVTLTTVGLGVGVLILALSLSSAFSRLLAEQLAGEGLVVMVANARLDAEGNLEQVKPLQFDAGATAALLDGVTGAVAASPITFAPWTEFLVESARSIRDPEDGAMRDPSIARRPVPSGHGTGYQFRTVYGVGEEYLQVMGLELVAGSAFTAAEVAAGARQTLLSATLAELLFGSPAAALGRVIEAPAGIVIEIEGEGMAEALAYLRRLLSPVFTVRGVFADPGEIGRRAYGIADMIVPATAVFPGKDTAFMEGLVMSRIALRVTGSGYATIESQVRAALAQQYGAGVAVAVWEGEPTGAGADLDEARATVATFSLVVNLLGFVLLVTACVGILGIMLVEVLGRTREIAVARALGASRGAVTREFCARALITVTAAALIGCGLSLLLAAPLTDLVVPIFRGLTPADLGGNVITPRAVALGVGSALAVGGLFGVLPLLAALRAPIAEALRE